MRVVLLSIAVVALLALSFVVWSFGHEQVTWVEHKRYDQDVVLKLVITSSGGATGDETYRVSSIYRGEEMPFFEGADGDNFALQRWGKSVAITFCDGRISRAQPIRLPKPRSDRIQLHLKLDC